uniref:Axin-1 n=1 Tax=Scleropages formosus TaxID=113540 RepID=A0A8C9RSN6_SCLFO
MSVRAKELLVDLGGSFNEDAPRPPVPGEEGELVSRDAWQCGQGFHSIKGEASMATPRRADLDLGFEPEGSASPTPPYLKWAESLHSLLDDQDGIHLFMTFLKQEDCADMLDFWFACSGFRKLEASECSEEKKLKLAKAIYKKYILDSNGIVSRQIKPATKSFIKDCVAKLHIDPAMFDQAQTEIQTLMEENTYPLFLKSDIYLEYTRTGGESPKLFSDQCSVPANGKVLPGYLSTVKEDEEWQCDREAEEQPLRDQTPSNLLTQKLLMETASHRVVPSKKYQDNQEYRCSAWKEPANPYYVNTGYALAPTTSANDSEQQSMSSDAETLSLTDSSVDGIPPYRYRKQHRRDIQESVKANGLVPLPHIPRTYRMPKDIHVDPEKFATELICRLEGVLREREAQEKLEERLKRVQLEEEGDNGHVSMVSSPASHRTPFPTHPIHYTPRYSDLSYSGLPLRDSHEEDPESILDEHVQRVMKTPGCQSPGTGHHSPKLHLPDGTPSAPPSAHGKNPAKLVPKPEARGLYHHKYMHHHSGAKEQLELDTAPRLRMQSNFAWTTETHHYANKACGYSDSMGMGASATDTLGHSKVNSLLKRTLKKVDLGKADEIRGFELLVSSEELERNQKIIQWMKEGEKEVGRHKKNSCSNSASSKKIQGYDVLRSTSAERPGQVHPRISAQLRNNVQPSHPFIQDPTMPPNPAPNPLTQLEEARRRLQEERKTSGTLQAKQRQKGMKKASLENVTVAYYFCGEPIPYRTSVKGRIVTLGQFKELLTKKGSYRYYFKKVSDEFDCGVVFEEVHEDDVILPIFEEKIIGKVEKID